jgi:murein hydrolase activator
MAVGPRLRSMAAAALCLCLLGPVAAPPALAVPSGSTVEERVREKIRVLLSLEDLERKAAELEASRVKLSEALKVLKLRRDRAREQLAEHEKSLSAARTEVHRVVQLASVLGRQLPLDVLLTGADLQENLRSRRAAGLLLDQTVRAARANHARKQALDDLAAGIERTGKLLEKRRETEALAREHAEAARARHEARFDELQSDPELRRALADDAGRIRDALRDELAELEAWRGARDTFDTLQGQLRLPFVPAKIEVRFGEPDRSARRSVALVHCGVVVRILREVSKDGVSMRAIAWGRVDFAGDVPGYGPTVVVDHGVGFHGVYAGFEELRVKAGEVVKPRAALGYFKRTKVRPRAVLELWKDGVPVDPAPWFQ